MNFVTFFFFFFFNDTATTEIYTLSLHDALPIWLRCLLRTQFGNRRHVFCIDAQRLTTWTYRLERDRSSRDRKSTRLNSSHLVISYAVFCLKKKNISLAHLTVSCVCLLQTN